MLGGLVAVALAVGGGLAPAFAQPKPDPAQAKPKPDPAHAKPKPDARKGEPTPTTPAAPATTVRGRAAITRVAESLARDLAQVSPRAVVVASVPTSDIAAPRARELAAAIATQVAGRRGAGSRAHNEPLPLASARGVSRGEPVLVYLTVEIAAGQLRVAADVFQVPRTVWARLRDPEPGPMAHAFVQTPIDAEVRSFLAPVPLTAFAPVRAKHFENDVVALACGDIDQDGAMEIAAVSRRRVTTLRLRAGKVLPLTSRSWPDLVGVHPAPLREPIGMATIVERSAAAAAADEPLSALDIGLTDRARSVRLDGGLRLLASFVGLAVPDGSASACTRMPALTVTGPIAACQPGDALPLSPSIGGQYDAFASAQLVSPKGELSTVWAGRERGVVELRDDKGHAQTIEGAGAQLAVGDLDQDGEPEILTSLDVHSALEDAVVIRTWPRGPKGVSSPKPREIARLPSAAGVQALGVCPPDGAGRAPFVVATADEIWVVR
jgi:hypothetical protein